MNVHAVQCRTLAPSMTLLCLALSFPGTLAAQRLIDVGIGMPEDTYPCPSNDCAYSGSPYVSTLYDGVFEESATGQAIVAGADLDKDGYEDVVIGAPFAEQGVGAVHVVYGNANPFYRIVHLEESTTILGMGKVTAFASALAVGDMSGDGIPDLAIGAPNEEDGMGAVYVVLGGTRWTDGQVEGLPDAFRLLGPQDGKQFGTSLAVGDVTGDGLADLVVGAPGSSQCVVFRGPVSWNDEPFIQYFNTEEEAGYSVAVVGDLNANGYNDFVVGAPNADNSGGRAYFLDGILAASVRPIYTDYAREPTSTFEVAARTTPQGSDMTVILGDLTNGDGRRVGALGTSVAAIGDINGDGYPDVALGAPYAPDLHDEKSLPGRVYLITGGEGFLGAEIPLSDISTFFVGEVDGAEFGTSVSSAGDADGNRALDLLVGAPGATLYPDGSVQNTGATYLLWGGTSEGWPTEGRTVSDHPGYRFLGLRPSSLTGLAVFGSPDFDLDNDQFDDILIGLPRANGDTQGTEGVVAAMSMGDFFDRDGDGQPRVSGDCDIDDPDVFYDPSGLTEVCDGKDNDCDGRTDDNDDPVQGQYTYYIDVDLDRYGSSAFSLSTCFSSPPVGYTTTGGDCNDFDSSVHPGAGETCDGIDNDCDELIDDDDPDVKAENIYFQDNDGDKYGRTDSPYPSCADTPPAGYAANEGDCDDANPNIYPGAPEGTTLDPDLGCLIADGIDNDCNPSTPLDQGTCTYDDDGDGHSERDGDCDDANPDVGPGQPEICDEIDQDCDGETNNGFDLDNDGHLSQTLCTTSPLGDDCDDSDPNTYANAQELCDGSDNDCDTLVDEDFDVDGDGFLSLQSCPSMGADCDDSDPFIHPGAPELCDDIDQDCDGDPINGFDNDQDGYVDENLCPEWCASIACEGCPAVSCDCDDTNPEIHPGALEICDGIDNNCQDGTDDEFNDLDGDSFPVCNSSDPATHDCNDTDPHVYPGAEERCDGLDNDCDGSPLEETGEVDSDGDGVMICEGDCDDSDAAVHPGAEELCNGTDDDCDGASLEETGEVDSDGDGVMVCEGDCDDTQPAVYPDAEEVCDDLDNDCNGDTDDNATDAVTVYTDTDGDGFGKDGDGTPVCTVQPGQAAENGDCDDTDPAVYPGAEELCNGVDDNCDSIQDEDDPTFDQDGDGALDQARCSDYPGPAQLDCDDQNPDIHPDAEEIPGDGLDNNCDGRLWEQIPEVMLDESIGCACRNAPGTAHPTAATPLLFLGAIAVSLRKRRRKHRPDRAA